VSTPVVGWIPRTPDPRVASVRIRCLGPMRMLARAGWVSEHWVPARRYDVVVFVKRFDAEAVDIAARLRAQGTRVITDLCDNPFYNPNGLASVAEMANGVRRMAAHSNLLVTSSDALATVAREQLAGGPPVIVIGDALDEGLSELRPSLGDRVAGPAALRRLRRWAAARRAEGRVPLVWFGIHGGPQAPHGMADLERIRPQLERLESSTPVSLTVVSNSASRFQDIVASWRLPVRYVEWRPSTFADALSVHDIAVLPVSRNPFTDCKSNNRVVTALWAGLAVVADGIPSYRDFADCIVLDDWDAGLARYLASGSARAADVETGRRRVASEWRLDRIAAQWRALLGAGELTSASEAAASVTR
jgi:hypothetical protein